MTQEAAKNPTSATPTTPAPKKKSRLKKLLKWTLILFLFLGVLLAVAPAVASATFLTGTVRGQLKKQFGENADVGKVSFGWTSGLVVEKVRIPSGGPHAKVKDRNAIELDGLHVDMSLVKMIKAAATGGEAETSVVVDAAKIYLELHPNGKLNLAQPEAAPADSKTAPATEAAKKPADDKPLPCSARSTINVKTIDLEIADMTSSTGTVQRTIIKGFHVGLVAHVDKERNAQLDTLDAKDSTLSFDELKVTSEEVGKPSRLVIAIDKPSVVAKLKFAGKAPRSAELAGLAALAATHQLDATPTLDVVRIYSDDFDLRGLAIKCTVGPDGGKQVFKLSLDGKLHGNQDGGIQLAATADLGAGKGKLPVGFEMHLNQVDISGVLAKTLPTLLPVLSGAESSERGKNKLPALSFNTKGSVETHFDAKETFEKDPTLKTIVDSGDLFLGPGSFDGSKILQAFTQAFEKLQLREYLDKAAGGDPFTFDGVIESFKVKDGVVTIDKLELSKKGYGLTLAGTVDFGGHYKLAIHFDEKMYKPETDVTKILHCIDKAGGCGVEGDLGGSCNISTPPADVLARAMLEGGALDLLRSKNPKLAGQFDDALKGAGTSVEKVVNDPGQAAKDVAKDQGQKEADKAIDRNKDKIEKATGVKEDKLKDGVKSIFGDDKKDDAKKDDEKKDDKKPGLPPLKNPFGD